MHIYSQYILLTMLIHTHIAHANQNLSMAGKIYNIANSTELISLNALLLEIPFIDMYSVQCTVKSKRRVSLA